VEALTELAEPDGSAPKSLFTWMASRYPLHTNFRPSASQALQKAFKRGRLEKGSNGRYRLNASWDGGSVGSIALGSINKLAHDFFVSVS
jgi:linker histone H1 and H5 family